MCSVCGTGLDCQLLGALATDLKLAYGKRYNTSFGSRHHSYVSAVVVAKKQNPQSKKKISCCAFGCHRNAKKDLIFIFIECRSQRRILKRNAGLYGCKPLSGQTGLLKPVKLLKHDYIIFTYAVHNVLALFETFENI